MRKHADAIKKDLERIHRRWGELRLAVEAEDHEAAVAFYGEPVGQS